MHVERELIELFLLWLAFTTVVGLYVGRIAMILRAHVRMERVYRLRLAMRMGAAARVAETGERA